MKCIADSSFHIGEQHLRLGKPCQDYTLSGSLLEDTRFAIVSDGCSSGGMTDFGARLMCLATQRALELQYTNDESRIADIGIMRNAYLESYRASLQLHSTDLLATCLWLVVNREKAVVSVAGDGVIALKYENGLKTITYSWEQNTPYYPAYRLSNLDSRFMDVHAHNPEPFIEEIMLHGEHGSSIVRKRTLRDGMQEQIVTLPLTDSVHGKLNAIGIFSDGVEQVDQVSFSETEQALMSFRIASGQFAVRRMNRFIQDVKKRGRGPLDGIAYAVINLDYTKETIDDNIKTTDENIT